MMIKRTNGNHGDLQQALNAAQNWDEAVDVARQLGGQSKPLPPNVKTWDEACAAVQMQAEIPRDPVQVLQDKIKRAGYTSSPQGWS